MQTLSEILYLSQGKIVSFTPTSGKEDKELLIREFDELIVTFGGFSKIVEASSTELRVRVGAGDRGCMIVYAKGSANWGIRFIKPCISPDYCFRRGGNELDTGKNGQSNPVTMVA